jgi:hypothetical protein
MYPNRVKPRFIVIEMGNGANPEVFSPLCGIKTAGMTAQLNTNDDFEVDCADPEAVPVRFVIPTGRQWDMSGSGVANLDNLEAIFAAQGVTKNYRYSIGKAASQTGNEYYLAGPAVLTNVQIGGSEDNFASIDLTFVSDGEWELVEA